MLNNTKSQPSKLKRKNYVEANNDGRGTNNTNTKIKFKTTRLKVNLCHYCDAYIFVIEIIIIARAEADAATRRAEERKKTNSI